MSTTSQQNGKIAGVDDVREGLLQRQDPTVDGGVDDEDDVEGPPQKQCPLGAAGDRLDASKTQITLDSGHSTPTTQRPRKLSATSLKGGGTGWKLKYQDFMPPKTRGETVAPADWQTSEHFQ